jgi:hypothetical protein
MEECGGDMVYRHGVLLNGKRLPSFYGCANYHTTGCKYKLTIDEFSALNRNSNSNSNSNNDNDNKNSKTKNDKIRKNKNKKFESANDIKRKIERSETDSDESLDKQPDPKKRKLASVDEHKWHKRKESVLKNGVIGRYFECTTDTRSGCKVAKIEHTHTDNTVKTTYKRLPHLCSGFKRYNTILDSEVRKDIRKKLQQGVSEQKIYRDAVVSSPNPLDRTITPSLQNIYEEQRKITNDKTPFASTISNIASTIPNWARYFGVMSSGTSSIQLLLMTDDQRDLLVKYGNDKVFIDGTWTLIEEKLQLISVLVKLPTGKSFPVAFIIVEHKTGMLH